MISNQFSIQSIINLQRKKSSRELVEVTSLISLDFVNICHLPITYLSHHSCWRGFCSRWFWRFPWWLRWMPYNKSNPLSFLMSSIEHFSLDKIFILNIFKKITMITTTNFLKHFGIIIAKMPFLKLLLKNISILHYLTS